MVLVAGAAVAAVVAGIALVAARDMDRRGRSGEVYAVAILFVLPLGLLMWALDRRRPPADPALTQPAEPVHDASDVDPGAARIDGADPAARAAGSALQNRRE